MGGSPSRFASLREVLGSVRLSENNIQNDVQAELELYMGIIIVMTVTTKTQNAHRKRKSKRCRCGMVVGRRQAQGRMRKVTRQDEANLPALPRRCRRPGGCDHLRPGARVDFGYSQNHICGALSYQCGHRQP